MVLTSIMFYAFNLLLKFFYSIKTSKKLILSCMSSLLLEKHMLFKAMEKTGNLNLKNMTF